MVTEIFIIAGVAGLIALFFIKLWNLIHAGKAYEPNVIYLGMAVGFILWLLMFFSFGASLSNETTAVIQDGNSTINIVQNTNKYVGYLPFLNLANLLMLVCFLFTLLETIAIANSSIIQKKGGPRSEQG